MQILANLLKRARHSGKTAANSFGKLRPKREVVLNGFKGPESDFGGSKIHRLLGPSWLYFGQNLAEQN